MFSKYYRTQSMQRCTVLLVLNIVDFVLLLLAIYIQNKILASTGFSNYNALKTVLESI